MVLPTALYTPDKGIAGIDINAAIGVAKLIFFAHGNSSDCWP